MENKLIEGSDFKGIYHQYQQPFHHGSSNGYAHSSHETFIAPVRQTWLRSSGFCDQNLQFSALNRSNTGCGMLSSNNGYTSPCFPKSINEYHRYSSELGKPMHSLKDHMVASPQQFSSLMARFDAESPYFGRKICEAEATHPIGGFLELTPGSGLRKRHVSSDIYPRDYIIQDMQPPSKRMKIENVVQHDDWSLNSIVSSFLEQRVGRQVDNTSKTNKEVISFKEVPTSVATWNANAAADASPKACFGKSDRLLGLRHSPDGCILNKEVLSCMGKTGNNDVIEVINLDDEDPEMDYVTTSIPKSDVTFDYQSTSLDNINVLPQLSSTCEGESTKVMMDDFKMAGVSLIDFFTSEQIKVHLRSLNPCLNLNAPAPAVGPNTCQLCVKDGLTFSAVMYCTSCGAPITQESTYYWTQDGTDSRSCFCTKCFRTSLGGSISFRGLSFSKATLHKDKNIGESGEPWVQCDKCEQWQHQICALYNSELDLKGEVKYICPFCRLSELEAKVNVSIPAASGAQHLPRTKLSDHIEQRLFKSLEQERKQRAVGKNDEEVSGASDLTVRVVLAVKKQVHVKQQFLDILHNQTYPTEFPYKSKVILLFQKIEGVDVCIFAMYVQEFGSECGNPNKRSVYISYLDSVKYFRPDIKACNGVPLRTFVYQEILIGYLDYCKRRGFVTCYIWACPSIRGDDYILHCHPEEQKMPNSTKLVKWYKKMLKKAKAENVVVGSTNFNDHFFVPKGGSNCKITAARLPYFDGDYWSGAIVDIVQTIEKDSEGNSKMQSKHQLTKRAIRAMGHNDCSADTRKDILVMHKLEHKMLDFKDDFFVVHLHFTCSSCHEPILSGRSWSCTKCSKFHSCGRCVELEKFPVGMESHTTRNGEKHQLHQTPVIDADCDIEDKDDVSDNNLFDDRCSFLELCQKNHYQFDTLRRAKHSSMMILHHLQTSKATTVGTICSMGKKDSVTEFNVCNTCYQKEGDGCHVHKLVQPSTKTDSEKKSKQIQQRTEADFEKKTNQIQQQQTEANSEEKCKQMEKLEARLMEILNHANECREKACSYKKCVDIKKLFIHGAECQVRVRGGCVECRNMWSMLLLHARNCTDCYCRIPRCTELTRWKRLRNK